MGRFFNMESPLFVALGRLADLMLLNLIFMITCIPVITIGASCTAMSYMTLKLVRNEESYIIKGYFKSFKENFAQATIIWIGVMIVSFILYCDFRVVMQMTGMIAKVMKVSLAALVIFFALGYIYFFPVLSKFYNSCVNTVKNSFIMAIANFPRTIAAFLIDIAAVVVTFINGYTIVWGVLIWILFGFSTVSYWNSKLFVKVFDKYIPQEEETPSEEPEVYEMTAFKNLQPQAIKKEVSEVVSDSEPLE